MAIDFNELHKKAKAKDEAANKKNGGKVIDPNYQQNKIANDAKVAASRAAAKETLPVKTTKSTVTPNYSGSNTRRRAKTTDAANDIILKEQAEHALPRAVRNASEAFMGNSVSGTIYNMKTGQTAADAANIDNPYSEELHSGVGADLGKFVGSGAAFMSQSVLASPATGRVGKALANTKLGKAVAGKLGGELTEGLAENAVDALTVGVAQNIGMGYGSGLRGKELAKDVAINTGADIAFGSLMEGAGAVLGKLGNNKHIAPNVEIPAGADVPNSNVGKIPEQQTGKVYESVKGDIMDTDTKTQVYGKIADRSGMNIEQKPLPPKKGMVQAGKYDPETKTATLNKTAGKDTYTTLKHELTHHLQSSEMYGELSDFIFKGMRDNGFDVDALRAQKKADYSAALGREIDDVTADQELIAEFCGEYLFNSEQSIERLARENPNLFQKIYDWIRDTIAKIGATDEQKFLIDAQRKYERVIENVKKNPSKDGGEVQNFFVRATDEEIAKAEKMLADGKTPADVQRELKLSKNSKGDWVYETADENAVVIKHDDMKSRPLGEVLIHDELYERVPELKNVRIKNNNEPAYREGLYNNKTKKAEVSKNLPKNKYERAAVHEVQHGVQDYQNMPEGASPEFWMKHGTDKELVKNRNLFNATKAELGDLAEEYVGILESIGVKLPGNIVSASEMGMLYDEIFDNPKGWEQLQKLRNKAVLKKQLNKVEQLDDLMDRINEILDHNEIAYYKMKAGGLENYKATAGEIEANEVANRFSMSDAERRNTMPNHPGKDALFVEDYLSIGKSSFDPNDSLHKTSEHLYGEKGNKYHNASEKPKTARTAKKEVKVEQKPKQHKDLGADALNPNYHMTFEEASQRMKTYKNGTPTNLPGKGDVSKAADTIIGSDIAGGEEMQALLRESVDNFVKTSKSNKVTLDNAYADLTKDGLDKAAGKLSEKLESGSRITEEDIAMGAHLIEELNRSGKYEEALNVVGDVVEMLTHTGRTLQAARIFSKMTPYGRVKTIRRNAEKMEKFFGKKIQLDEGLLKELFDETDENKLNSIKRKIMLDMWEQVPSGLMNKLDAIRYTAMLSSPKTHMRNILGNGAMYIGKALSDGVESALEETVFKGKMDKLGAIRNKSFLTGSEADRKLKEEAGDLFESIKESILNQDVKYFENGSMSRPLEAGVFTGKNPASKLMEGSRKLVSGSLEREDEFFMKLNFKSAFAQICKANGLTMQDLSAKELRAFTDYAIQQAQQATFRDSNKLAELFNRLYRQTTIKPGDTLGTKAAKTAGKVAMDATLPFKKTPANVLKQGYRYSPAGLVHGLGKIAFAKDAKSLIEGIDMLSNGIVGTPVLAAGAFLAAEGAVNSSLGEYTDKKTQYDKMTGKQDYSVIVGDKTITLDWLSPYSMPFFVGVELGNAFKDGGVSGYEAVDALAGITNPFFEMSMLQGLQTLMTSNYETSGPQEMIQNTLKTYVSQFVPALSAQIAKTVAPVTTSTSVKGIEGANTSSGKFVASTAASLKSKVPGLYSQNEETVDLWGRTESKETAMDYVKAGFRNIISPANIKEINVTPVDEELLRLYDKLGEEDGKVVIPNVPNGNSNKLTYDGETYEMTASQFTQYKKDVGQYRYKELEKLFKTTEYKRGSAEERAEMISDVYTASNAYGKMQYLISSGKMSKSQYDYSTLSVHQKSAIQSGKSSASKVAAAADKAKDLGLSAESSGMDIVLGLPDMDNDTLRAYSKNVSDTAISEARALMDYGYTLESWKKEYAKALKYDADGNESLKKDEMIAYLDTTGYGREKKNAMLKAATGVTKDYY